MTVGYLLSDRMLEQRSIVRQALEVRITEFAIAKFTCIEICGLEISNRNGDEMPKKVRSGS
jgi:hypothetical protein